MKKLKPVFSQGRVRAGSLVVLLVIVAAGTGVLVTSAFAKRDRSAPRARAASARSLLPATASVAATDSNTETFVSQNAGGEECVNAVTQGVSAVVGACGKPASIEREGLVDVSKGPEGLVILALLPKGDQSLKVTEQDGSVHELAAKSGAVVGEDANAGAVSFSTPGGEKSIDVAGMAAQLEGL